MNKMMKDWINAEYLDPKIFKKQFLNNKPFPNIEFQDFLKEEKAVDVLKALLIEKFFHKDADLFQFKQTNDLKNTSNKDLKDFISFLYSKEFINFMQEMTGFKLSDKTDIAGTLYESTDYLLCHDDQLEGRKIAYLFYFTDFEESDGGSLNLFSSKNNIPDKIIKKIIPRFNKFAFFEVFQKSFHEVEEVIAEKQRIAIGGWFYDK